MARLWSRIRHYGASHDSKLHGANMGPICGRQEQGGPHVGPMNIAGAGSLYLYLFIHVFMLVFRGFPSFRSTVLCI